ncbi:hypothetical protein SMACR_01077 [Sordaria macrospora]|nr:hypothetical protein SMACR_01077 [Sordaria macrospora]KAH7630549.1 hydrophobic surface binding protein A-domain-containing protein [Sordaria sp. MPI-SDFR-AT-0083]WPJ62318.1 hypothetical protein SMAC4_01077 [Sordaria macrospora]
MTRVCLGDDLVVLQDERTRLLVKGEYKGDRPSPVFVPGEAESRSISSLQQHPSQCSQCSRPDRCPPSSSSYHPLTIFNPHQQTNFKPFKMKFTTLLAPVAILASTVAADAASIQTALDTINLSTLKLKNYVDTWNGKLLTVIPIVGESTSLLASINRGKQTAEESEELDTLGALGVGEKTSKLATSVNQTITTIITSKPKFDKLLLSPTILLNLKLEKKATEELNDVIISKIPELFRDFARSLSAPIIDSFDEAIETYKLF